MKIIIASLLAAIIAQIIKIIFYSVKHRSFSFNRALGYGGWPSSHAALVGGLSAGIYFVEGASPAFAVSVILATVVLRDAIGLRGYLQEHGRILNKLIKDLPDNLEYKYPVLEEKIAHTIFQLISGAIIGILIVFFIMRM